MPWWQGGLRSRLLALMVATSVFATVGTLGLSYWGYRTLLLEQKQKAVITDLQQRTNAQSDLLSGPLSTADLVTLAERIGGDSVIATDTDSFGSASTIEEVPAELRRKVSGDGAAPGTRFQRVHIEGVPTLVVGITPASNDSAKSADVYVFGFTSLEDEARLLDRLILTGVSAAVGVLGISVLIASFATRRTLRPLERLDQAARALADGKPLQIVQPVGRDEVARLTATFNASGARIDQLVTDLRRRESDAQRFAEDVSHELRTPLTAMVSVASVLDDRAHEFPAELATAVMTLAEEARRMATLVTDLLDISRPESALDPSVTVTARPGPLVARCLRAAHLDQSVSLFDETGDAVVAVDTRRFHAIVVNLVSNALHHGGPPVSVRLTHDENQLVMSVRDHGAGIPEEVRDHVFDRFYKVESSRSRSAGSGLGLSIVAKNVALHGATISVREPSGGGTEFIVSFPVASGLEDW